MAKIVYLCAKIILVVMKDRKQSLLYLEMKTHQLKVPYTGKMRRVRVLLPADYDEHPDAAYPVVYMHDGQNVFHSREAYSGHSWKVVETIRRNPDMPKMIVVGIDNDEDNRMNEYAPWRFTDLPELSFDYSVGGVGSEYAAFVMQVIKPFIDSEYRTKTDKAHTVMIGSSLGANITQYMGLAYKDKIGGLGVFSSANWLNLEQFERYIKKFTLDEHQRVYIEVGTQEGDDADKGLTYGNVKQSYISASLDYYRQLIDAGMPTENISLNVIAEGTHSEECWAAFLPECLRFLSEMWGE